MNPHYPQVATRAGYRCEYCHAPQAVFNVPFEVEHINPLAKGGHQDDSNRALACRSCNLNKSDRIDAVDPATTQRVRLFNPREDNWQDHFVFEPTSTMQLQSKTPIGRATIEQLRMNSDLQLAARSQWLELGLFP